MPFYNQQERDTIKSLLSVVLDDADLAQQFNKAVAAKAVEPGDHRSAMLGQYASILKEIQDERAKPFTPPPGAVSGPSLEQLRKKYLGK